MNKICIKCQNSEQWLPTPINDLDTYLSKFFKNNNGVLHVSAIRKNIAYNIQHLQFQSQLLSEFKITQVILTQNWKVYIIVGISIIECILYYLLKSKSLHTVTEWEHISKTSNYININKPNIYKLENYILKKLVTPIPSKMKFDDMIKKVQKHELLGKNEEIYKKLNHLKKLRNRVHLQSVEHYTDTDWFKFNIGDFKTMKKILHIFLTSSLFKPTPLEKKMFKFLK